MRQVERIKKRTDSNLKDLRNTRKWTTTSRGAWKRLKKTGWENSVVRLKKIWGRTKVRGHTNWWKDLTTVKQGKVTTIQDCSGKYLTEERQILNRWTEYCSKLYNHKANRDPTVLDCPQTDTEDDHPILRKEVQASLVEESSLKKGKSVGVYNIPEELVQAGVEDVITTLTTIYDKIWQTGEWPTLWTQSLVITLPKKGNLPQCQNFRNIILISHPKKVVLKIILNRLKPQAEKITAEEQAGFRAGRNTTEKIFNLRILCEKYLQHQQDLYHVFIDFKKAFNRVGNAPLWQLWRNTSAPTLSESSNTIIIRPPVQSSSTAA